MTDKRSESQFKGIKPIDTGDSVPEIRLGSVDPQNPKMADISQRPSSFIGGAASRMQALASLGKEDPESAAQVGSNKPVRLSTKEGRRKAAGHLGLPNVKRKQRLHQSKFDKAMRREEERGIENWPPKDWPPSE